MDCAQQCAGPARWAQFLRFPPSRADTAHSATPKLRGAWSDFHRLHNDYDDYGLYPFSERE
jgi:hypothetical protein